jgi:large subunit ribosomal protein L22
MEVRAIAKFVKVKPLMVRQVAREIRGKMAVPMVHELRFKAGKGAFVLHKVLVSAISNAEANHNLDVDTLRISEVKVDEGPKMKRMQARAMGRGNRILKRTAHITIVVSEGEPDADKSTRGKNVKPRPSLRKAGKRKTVAAKPVEEETSVIVVDEQPQVEEVIDQAEVRQEPSTTTEPPAEEETK